MSGIDKRRELLRDRDVNCPRCGYNLRGSGGQACPECGGELTVEQLQSPSQPRAVLAMWLGVAALLTCWLGVGLLPGIAAIYVGTSAINAIDRQGGRRRNRQQARVGVIAGGLSCVVAGLAFAVGLLLPAIGTCGHRLPRRMQNSTQVLGIHRSLVVFSNSNNGYFPGLDSQGRSLKLDVEDRMWLLLDGNYFPPEYLISPWDEATLVAWQYGAVTPQNYSYAILQVPAQGARRAEWADTLNSQAPVVADRNSGSASQPTSVSNATAWEGSVAWNDNRVEWQKTHVLPTRLMGTPSPIQDDLFNAVGDDDVLLIHSGN